MRLSSYAVFFVAAILVDQGAFAQATIEGKVELPQRSALQLTSQRYQNGAEAQTGPPDPPMAVVYLEGNFANAAGSPHSAEMAQKNINFAPNLLPIRVGTTVTFPNLDDTYHNVFSYSKTKRFDLGRYRKNEKPESVLFDKPGVVTLHCEVHGNMRGTILILDTPYFQKTNADGGYRLRDLPAGHYAIKAWLSENDIRSREVDLKPGNVVRVDFPSK